MWSEVRENLIWKCDDFFSPLMMKKIDEFINCEMTDVTTKSHTDGTPLITASDYHYKLVTKTPFADIGVHQELITKINLLWIKNNTALFPPPPLRTSQAMLKYFSKESSYKLHTEDTALFGEWVYIVYLTSEDSGQIYFPSEESVFSQTDKQELSNWKNMIAHLENKKSKFFYTLNDFTFLPQKNKALAFRVGLAHKVFPLIDKCIGRFCLTGWPFATFK